MGLDKIKDPQKFGGIAVLMGGPSTEREISLKSGRAVYDSLKLLGLDVVGIDITTDNPDENSRLIKSQKPDCVFIALHGRFGEDGQIQEILDNLKIPYTGSGRLASRLAIDKVAAMSIFEIHGLDVPRYKVMEDIYYTPNWKVHNILGFPLVIKPATHGSSIGLSIIDKPEALDNAVATAFSFDSKIIIQEYIRGREITVGILDESALPVIEIVPKKRFFDYEAKYQVGMTDYIVPANLDEAVVKKAQSAALEAHKLLGCLGCSRVDMILNQDNTPVILEINTIPGLTQTSLLPKAAKIVGIDFCELCLKLIELAYEKAKNKSGA
jgi:D-alanine-D-alanine ligase